jgi:hypothetical protein
MKALAREFESGKLRFPTGHEPNTRDEDQPEVVEMKGMIDCLARVQTPECDRALNALARQDHPYHALAAKWIRRPHVFGSDELAWYSHPFCIAILQPTLNDVEPTGGIYKIDGNFVNLSYSEGSFESRSMPEFLDNSAVRRAEAKERACDAAAMRVEDMVFGLPRYHPLLIDADRRLEDLKLAIKRFQGRFRVMTAAEKRALEVYGPEPKFVVDIQPLGRPATAQDVADGKAVFSLDGKGKPAKMTLPAVAVWKEAEAQRRQSRVLIVQAEVGPDGETVCGVLGPEGTQTLRLSQLTRVAPIKKRSVLGILLNPGEK